MFLRRKITLRILEYINSSGKMSDKELYELLSKEFGISYNQLLSLLMQLEIEGFLRVSVGRECLVTPKKTLNQ